MSTFNKCIANGSYDTVSPGEFCSLQTAKKLGIEDSGKYFQSEYNDLKTFNESKDTTENRKSEICSVTKKGDAAYQMCAIEHGIGFVRQPARPEKCITVSCPPGFESDRGECKKPLEDYTVSKRARCDERWYDWFIIPNYHLGNKYYEEKPGKCYKPCPSYNVPQYAKDPVDESSAGFNATEKLDKCLPRTQYMNGKYMMGSDYCPISWVYRLAATPSVLKEQINTNLDQLKEEKKNTNDKYEALRSSADTDALEIAKEAGSLIENINVPDETMRTACQSLTTTDRVQFAYDVCERLAEDETWYGQNLEDELKDSDQVQQAKTKMLKQACNALFCSGNSHEQVGKPEICIPGVTPVEPIDDDSKIPPPPSSEGAKQFIFTSSSFALKAILVSIVGVLLYLFIVNFLYPLLKKLYIKIRDYFRYKKTSENKGKFETINEESNLP